VGLFFVKEAADLHHGHVTVKNHLDGGVIAEFIMPR
jgi:signal transduction histidine kinase